MTPISEQALKRMCSEEVASFYASGGTKEDFEDQEDALVEAIMFFSGYSYEAVAPMLYDAHHEYLHHQ